MKEKFRSIKICPLWASVRLSRVSVRTGFPCIWKYKIIRYNLQSCHFTTKSERETRLDFVISQNTEDFSQSNKTSLTNFPSLYKVVHHCSNEALFRKVTIVTRYCGNILTIISLNLRFCDCLIKYHTELILTEFKILCKINDWNITFIMLIVLFHEKHSGTNAPLFLCLADIHLEVKFSHKSSIIF